MSSYLLVKQIHVACVVLSLGGFLLRGTWMLLDSNLLQRKLVRRLPHVVDTLLLASALYLVLVSRQYPFQTPWLTAKLLALLLYIGLGMLALRHGRSRRQRRIAFAAALMTAAYMVLVALQRDVTPLI